jgi:hypothetical protein
MTARFLVNWGAAGGGAGTHFLSIWPTPVPSMTVEGEPKSTLVVPGREVKRASNIRSSTLRNHQDARTFRRRKPTRREVVADMDRLSMRVMVNLSSGQGETFVKGLQEP